ncbi:MAG: hypothetical protein M3R38_02230 [Actinomycetota bacterium]|nr:hypothetical protein [Actinomycetota bacterium]
MPSKAFPCAFWASVSALWASVRAPHGLLLLLLAARGLLEGQKLQSQHVAVAVYVGRSPEAVLG